jgi:hypothetical protein
MANTTNLPANIRNAAVELLPDSDRYKVRFKVKSSSSSSLHLVSFDNAPGAQYWTCSCFGNRRYGQCHHLTDLGLKGRKYGHQSLPSFIKAQLATA